MRDVARRWWRIGLSAEEIKSLEAEARALCANGDGPRPEGRLELSPELRQRQTPPA